jgi:hypothetical protein
MAEELMLRRERVSWPAIFAGTFIALGIEATFGLLGLAILHPSLLLGRLGPAAGIWLVVLSVFALYFGGRAARRLSGASSRAIGMYHGLATFGLSIFAALLIASMLAGSVVTTVQSGLASMLAAGSGWWLFLTLGLSGLAAITGGLSGEPVKAQVTVERPSDLRSAA